MRELPVRKNNRLAGYDYSKEGLYFITICVEDKYELLGTIVGDGVLDVSHSEYGVPYCRLSDMGNAVDMQLQVMNRLYDNVCISKYVIMPNHIHMILLITCTAEASTHNSGSSRTPTPTNAIIPSFVSTFKRYTNKACGFAFWQRSYHDHIIRNEAEYEKIWRYIAENPARWRDDVYFADAKPQMEASAP